MTEANLQTRILRLAKTCGYLTYHTHDSRRSQPGWPDLVLANKKTGILLFRELKTERGRVRPEQKEWIETLTALGQDAAIWRPSDLLSGAVFKQLQPDT
ncbi:VRR-NUC domain-containing protein [Timonella senegalensis]|uniref:VRR-NUC domain-containing protein n=1 Tax=Timonella senegalensis TaxID=1465825 RepID=UPI0002E4BF2B|nr:VRR-NUC domain-containing protein [Timonella senegalensis]